MKTLFILHEPVVLNTYQVFNEVPENSEVLIPFIGSNPLEDCYYALCIEAITVQKRQEFFNIGKKLGIKKITNLNMNEYDIDYSKLLIQLQLYLKLNSISKVLYEEYNTELSSVYTKICDEYKIECKNIN